MQLIVLVECSFVGQRGNVRVGCCLVLQAEENEAFQGRICIVLADSGSGIVGKLWAEERRCGKVRAFPFPA